MWFLCSPRLPAPFSVAKSASESMKPTLVGYILFSRQVYFSVVSLLQRFWSVFILVLPQTELHTSYAVVKAAIFIAQYLCTAQ
mmetsp:Transcript_10023/g.19076  ORF Transcript_10023/g.19076 Transcript_10023/m.19076 type:complete len:83 (-) Transcript_10023:2312-2560(-)